MSFLCAPLIGALSDVWGRKSFLLVTVFSTCAPIPLLYISGVAYFIACALSGALAVTFSIVFSYVADCTDEEYRSCAYGLVSIIHIKYFIDVCIWGGTTHSHDLIHWQVSIKNSLIFLNKLMLCYF